VSVDDGLCLDSRLQAAPPPPLLVNKLGGCGADDETYHCESQVVTHGTSARPFSRETQPKACPCPPPLLVETAAHTLVFEARACAPAMLRRAGGGLCRRRHNTVHTRQLCRWFCHWASRVAARPQLLCVGNPLRVTIELSPDVFMFVCLR
jgi:hypothetical protein